VYFGKIGMLVQRQEINLYGVIGVYNIFNKLRWQWQPKLLKPLNWSCSGWQQ